MNNGRIRWKDVPEDVKKFMKEVDKELAKKVDVAIEKMNSDAEVVYIVKEDNEMKAITEEEALKNSLFPTLVKRAIKR